MSARTAQTLRAAAAAIEANGWCQSALHTPDGRMCLVGAIRQALGLLHSQRWSEELQESSVSGHLGEQPAEWNDRSGRTRAEVVKELLTVADLEDVT